MSKYIIIAKGELVTDSRAFDRAKEYAAMAIGDGEEAHIYSFVTTVKRASITLCDTLPADVMGKNCKPVTEVKESKAKRKRKRPTGTSTALWTEREDELLKQNISHNPGVGAFILAKEIAKYFPDRTTKAVGHRIRMHNRLKGLK